MLDQTRRQAAADRLWKHWQAGSRLDTLPEAERPATREAGYSIQALLEARSAAPLVGWKIAATSAAGQAHINVDGPLAGRLLAERVHESGSTLPLGGNAMRVAEPEFAFRMGRDLAPRDTPYSREEARDAVEALHPAIELPDSRYEDFTKVGAAQLIADNACAHEFVLGPATTADWRGLDLVAHSVRGRASGLPEREGRGANVLGDPLVALTWLVNELSGVGVTLSAGQVVTTGTCLEPLPIGPGSVVDADFGVLGGVSVTIGG